MTEYMGWKYRVMKREVKPNEFEFGIYEVYYDSNVFEMEIMREAFKKETLIY